MTTQEAIKRIQTHNEIHSRKEPHAVHITKALKIAIDALEKQIPKKPIHDSLADRACPACDAYIPFDALNDRISDAPRFCKNCGQSLDWGIENDI